jgi:hypothetical protein
MTQSTGRDTKLPIAITEIFVFLAAFFAPCIGLLFIIKVVQTPCISLFKESCCRDQLICCGVAWVIRY